MTGPIVVPQAYRPEGWDPRERPVRHCPIFLRQVHVAEACPRFCGRKFVDECKFADRDPRREEMRVAMPILVAEEGLTWVQNWRRSNSPLLRRGGRR